MKSKSAHVPFFLLVHIFLTGLAVAISVFIWLRQYSLIMGEHVVAISVLITAILIGIAAGSRFFGKRADKSRNLIRLMILLELGIVIYSVCFPLCITLFDKFADFFTYNMQAGPFRTTVIRFILAFLFLLPAAFAGGLVPVYSKYMIRHISHIGRQTGIVFTLLNTGAMAGYLITGIYLIRQYGYDMTIYLATTVMLINVIMASLFLSRRSGIQTKQPSWPLAQKARKSGLSVIKKHAVLESESKLIRTMLWVFTIQGFTAIAYIILWIRTLLGLLAVDATIILTGLLLLLLSGLAIGGFVFKGIADRPRKNFYLLGLIEILIGISAAVSFIAMYLLLGDFQNNTGFLHALWPGITGKLVHIAVLIFLPAVFTGATFPVACRLYPKRIQKVGRRIGWLVAVFLTGSILGMFFTNFILIPLIGRYTSFFLVVIISIAIGLILILRDSRLKRVFRLAIFLIAFIVFVFLQSIFRKQDYNIHTFDLQQQDTIQVIKEGSTASVMLISRTEGYSDVLLNGKILLHGNPENIKIQHLLAYLPQLFGSQSRSAYLAGFGLGVTASSLEKCGFDLINITETSPEIISVTASAFAGVNNDILTNKDVSISFEDSRSFLNRSNAGFDLITFSYSYSLVRSSYYSQEFYDLCYKRLNENGVLCQTVPTSWISHEGFKSLLKACSDIFTDVSLWYAGADRMFILAAKNEITWDYCELMSRFDRLNADQKLTTIGFPMLESLLGCLVLDNGNVREISSGATEITDNHPVWELDTVEEMRNLIPGNLLEGSLNYSQVIDLSGNCVISERYILNIIESYRKIIHGEIR